MDSLAGVRFYPTDEEIIRLLQVKRQDPRFSVPSIFEANIYDHEPENLSRLPAIRSDEKWSTFYCEPNYIKSNSERVNRSTRTGYWKVTGITCEIKAKRTLEVIGWKRTLVFYERFPGSKEARTNWVMREYCAKPLSDFKKDYVVCRVKRKKDKRHISTKFGNKRATIPLTNANDRGQSSLQVALDGRNHVTEKSSPESQLPLNCHLISTSSRPDAEEIIFPEPQLLSSCNMTFNSTMDAVEYTYPELDFYSVFNSNNRAIEDTFQVDPSLLENENMLNGYTELDQTSFSTLKLPTRPEQLGSSYCFVSSNDNQLLNSPSGSEFQLEDYLQDWVLISNDEFLGEETGHSAYSSF